MPCLELIVIQNLNKKYSITVCASITYTSLLTTLSLTPGAHPVRLFHLYNQMEAKYFSAANPFSSVC